MIDRLEDGQLSATRRVAHLEKGGGCRYLSPKGG